MQSETTSTKLRLWLNETLLTMRESIPVELPEPPPQTNDPVLRAEVQVAYLMQSRTSDSTEVALAKAESVAKAFQKLDPESIDPLADWMRQNCHGFLLLMSGRFDEAEDSFERAIVMAKAANNSDWTAVSLLNLSKVLVRSGNAINGARVLSQVLHLDAPGRLVGHAESHLADLLDDHSQYPQALKYRRQSVERTQHESALNRIWVLTPLVVSLIDAGLLQEAEERLDECKSIVGDAQSPPFEAAIFYLTAFLAARSGYPNVAMAALPDRSTIQKHGRLVYNICVPSLATEVLLATNNASQASEVVETAIENCGADRAGVRLLRLAVRAAKATHNWEHAAVRQERLLAAIQERQGNTQTLLRLYQAGQSAAESRRLNDQLIDVRSQLQETRSARGELLDIVTHDVMSPATTLKIQLHLLANKRTRQPSVLRSVTADVHRTFEHLDDIVDQLTALTAEADPAPEVDRGNLADLVGSCVQAHRWLAEEKNIHLSYVVASQARAEVVWPLLALRQVLDNLLSNAIKYSDSGDDVNVVCTKVSHAPSATAHWCIVVNDSGPGLSEHDLQGLFSKYGRQSARPTNGETSTGLGLYIARNLATSAGANLDASSAGPGLGSSFRLCLPADSDS